LATFWKDGRGSYKSFWKSKDSIFGNKTRRPGGEWNNRVNTGKERIKVEGKSDYEGCVVF